MHRRYCLLKRKSYAFKSRLPRLAPIKIPKGPNIYTYDPKSQSTIKSTADARFKSKIPRLLPLKVKNQGQPGEYWPTLQYPNMPKPIQEMGRKHGVFFPSIYNHEANTCMMPNFKPKNYAR